MHDTDLFSVQVDDFLLPEAEEVAPLFDIGIIHGFHSVLFRHIADSGRSDLDAYGVLEVFDVTSARFVVSLHLCGFPVEGERLHDMGI